jgi:transcriptional regulator
MQNARVIIWPVVATNNTLRKKSHYISIIKIQISKGQSIYNIFQVQFFKDNFNKIHIICGKINAVATVLFVFGSKVHEVQRKLHF